MDATRYEEIKLFMNGRDVSSSFSDPAHNSTIDFSEFVYVAEQEAIKNVPTPEPVVEE